MAVNLNKIKLGVPALSEEIHLYRHGKDATLALERRVVTNEVLSSVVQWAFCGSLKDAKKVQIEHGPYTITVEKVK